MTSYWQTLSYIFKNIFCRRKTDDVGRDTVDGIATRYRQDSPVVENWLGARFYILSTLFFSSEH
jgi:hypothetical protein